MYSPPLKRERDFKVSSGRIVGNPGNQDVVAMEDMRVSIVEKSFRNRETSDLSSAFDYLLFPGLGLSNKVVVRFFPSAVFQKAALVPCKL